MIVEISFQFNVRHTYFTCNMYIVHVKEGPVFQVTFHVGWVTLQFESSLFSAVSRDSLIELW